ncbi:MAG: methyltransferase [Gammaproteobacteria bacterium]
MSADRDSVFSAVARYYDELVVKYGHDPRACDYGRAQSQLIKFGVLAEVLPLDRTRILDVGCGFADYATYLAGRFRDVTYAGIDLSDAMVAAARRLHPTLSIRNVNILEEDPGTFDVVTANGIFYLLGSEAPALMRELIARMFACARAAVAFNSLSTWAPDRGPGEFHADPAEVLNYCCTITPWVALRHDYHARDFTIYLYRNSRP